MKQTLVPLKKVKTVSEASTASNTSIALGRLQFKAFSTSKCCKFAQVVEVLISFLRVKGSNPTPCKINSSLIITTQAKLENFVL